jgi:hypothetical protein
MIRSIIWLAIGLLAASILAAMVFTPTPPPSGMMIERRPVPPK